MSLKDTEISKLEDLDKYRSSPRLNKEQKEKILDILENLEELDDVQKIYTNAALKNDEK